MSRVSIILTTYNRAHLIGQAIASAQAQSFTDWELLIVDGASTDNTQRVVEDYQKKDSRILFLAGQTNLGIAGDSNRGLRQAKGEYIAILDDDDRWADPDKLKKQVSFLDQHPDYVGVGGGMIVINAHNEELYRFLKPETDDQIREKMLFSNPMANSTTLFRLSAAEKVNFYDETLTNSADRDFWLKMGLVGKLHNLPEYFAYYLMAGQNTFIVKMRNNLKCSLQITIRYRKNYPYFWPALFFGLIQYGYSFLPAWLRKNLHLTVFKLKRMAFK